MESVNDSSEAQPAAVAENPHVLWRQLTGLVLWVGVFGVFGYFDYFGGGLFWAVFGLILASVTFADAWVSGIYKDQSKKSFLNISPMAWGVVMALLFIVAYPAYLINRNKLRTRQGGNAYFIATIVLGAVVLVLIVLNFIVTPYLGLGNVYDDLGQPEQAIEKYDQAIELEPDHPGSYHNRGKTLMRMREFKQALPDLDRAIELNSNYFLAYHARSLTHAALNQYDEATLDYARAMALDPERAFQITKVGIFKPINVAPDLTVTNSLFGTWQSDDKFGESFIQTGRVPLIKGQLFGWFLVLNTSRGTVKFREEFRLPHAPETWGSAETDLISEERQMMITEEEVQPDKDNVIGHSWGVAEGDPEGLYMMNIFIDDQLIETFIFWVAK